MMVARRDAEPDENGRYWFAHIYHGHSVKKRDRRSTSRRLVGRIVDDDGSAVEYPTPADPLTIKQLLIDLAIDMPSYEPHQIGAGFLDPAAAFFHLGLFGQTEFDVDGRWEVTTGRPVEPQLGDTKELDT